MRRVGRYFVMLEGAAWLETGWPCPAEKNSVTPMAIKLTTSNTASRHQTAIGLACDAFVRFESAGRFVSAGRFMLLTSMGSLTLNPAPGRASACVFFQIPVPYCRTLHFPGFLWSLMALAMSMRLFCGTRTWPFLDPRGSNLG
jgi:hypothetical protein